MRHYSKVIVELPDSPADPPYAVVSIDCDTCGDSEIKIHVQHLGTVLRVLSEAVNGLGDDGHTEMVTAPWVESTPSNKQKVKDHLDLNFPGWKGDRIRGRA